MKRSLRSWLWRVSVDREIDEELALHVDMRTREGIARGLDPATARADAITGSAMSLPSRRRWPGWPEREIAK
jgi:hypothetical protein